MIEGIYVIECEYGVVLVFYFVEEMDNIVIV